MITVQWILPGEEKSDAYQLRKDIFVLEQGFIDEFDCIDEVCEHLLLRNGGLPVATARLYEEGGVYHAGRICVAHTFRKLGIGRRVMDAVEQRARLLGARVLELGSQLQAQSFYEKCGYAAFGEIFYEQDCPHVMMRKDI